MRTADCGNCGLESQTCRAGSWVGDGVCLAQGVCAVGAVESRSTTMCQEERRICDSTCAWRDWSPVGAAGACTAGETRFVEGGACGTGTWRETCSATCTWTSTCEDPCRGMRRTSPWDEEEICIPGGDFVRGGGGVPEELPVATVFVSTFLMDRYPVTNRRYLACSEARMCGDALRPVEGYNDPAFADYPVSRVTVATAEAICRYTGGRLPTEAEYEKASRGPAPRTVEFLWGDTVDCARLPVQTCPGSPPDTLPFRPRFPVTGLPGVRSYYGVDMLTGAGRTWTADAYRADFYGMPESLRDPLSTHVFGTTTRGRSVRGRHIHRDIDEMPLAGRVYTRSSQVSSTTSTDMVDMTVRCVRDVPRGM